MVETKPLEIIVSKYGGKSLKDQNDIQRLRDITSANPKRRIAVVSAPTGVTNLLIKLAEDSWRGSGEKPSIDDEQVGEIIERYSRLHPKENVLQIIEDMLRHKLENTFAWDTYAAGVRLVGECGNAIAIANILGYTPFLPTDLFRLTGSSDDSRILPMSGEIIREQIGNLLLETDGIVIIGGYGGKTIEGHFATLGRSGTDTSADFVAAELDRLEGIKVVLYENMTDSALLSADPRVVKDPKAVNALTYRETRNLSYGGFGIFHPNAMKGCSARGIPIEIKGTATVLDEEHDITRITKERDLLEGEVISGIAYRDGFTSFDVSAHGFNDMVGVVESLLRVFRERGISIEYPVAGMDELSIIVKDNQMKEEKHYRDIEDELKLVLDSHELLAHYHTDLGDMLTDQGICFALNHVVYTFGGRDCNLKPLSLKEALKEAKAVYLGRGYAKGTLDYTGNVNTTRNLGIITIAGEGLKQNIGSSARVQQALADKNINIQAITQPISEGCLIYAINSSRGDEAVNAVYDVFLRNGEQK